MAKNWSKGTHPLDSKQQHITIPHQEGSQQEAASPVSEEVESIKEAASGDEASRRFLLRIACHISQQEISKSIVAGHG